MYVFQCFIQKHVLDIRATHSAQYNLKLFVTELSNLNLFCHLKFHFTSLQ